MATVQDLVSASLKRIGVLASGETPSAEESADALLRLNALVDSLANERLTIYTVTRTTWTITANDGSYTVGASGNVNIAWPTFVQNVGYIDTAQDPDAEYLLDLLSPEEYAAFGQKAQANTLPFAAYYNPTYPLGTVEFLPVPTSTTLLGVIYVPTAVASFASLATTISLPPGYERMLTSNLAIELAPEFGQEPSPTLIQIARDSKAAIKVRNYQPLKLRCDPALVGRGGVWNINTNSYNPSGG
jgi:hypothetical protein